MAQDEYFWVAELVDPITEEPFVPAIYWNGHTRPGFDAVTTLSIYESQKYRNAEARQRDIDKLDQCKHGILKPIEHGWM